MKKLIFCTCLALCAAFQPAAQPTDWPLAKNLDSLLNDPKYRPENPGFAVMVIQNGQIVYEQQHGMANLKKRLPVRAETMFNIGSISKQFTAAAILLLEERGQLRTTDPVQKYLPELPDFGATITLQHLIAHTSGIPDHFEVAVMQGKMSERLADFDKIVEKLRAAPELSFAPGSDFAYCNTAYMLLAMVVERVSGLSMHDFASKNIFQPLGMAHSNFFKKEADGLPDGTTSYIFKPGKGKFKHDKPYPNAIGATGVQTTLRDFFLWDQNFYQNRLGSGSLIEKMETSARLNDGSPTHYGGGLLLKDFQGHKMVAHGGGWNNFLMEYRRFPALGISVLVASNNDFSSPFPLADAICQRVLPKIEPSPQPSHTARPLPVPAPDLEGTFLSASNLIRKIQAHGAGVAVVIPQASGKEKLLPLRFLEKSIADNTLIFSDEQGEKAVFQLDAAGQTTVGFWWAGGHYFRVRRFYQKLEQPAAGLTLRAFSGKYRSEARQQTLRVRRDRKTGGLKLKPVFFLKYRLEPLGGAVFKVRNETVIIRFQPDGMTVGNDWTNGLRLKKVK